MSMLININDVTVPDLNRGIKIGKIVYQTLSIHSISGSEKIKDYSIGTMKKERVDGINYSLPYYSAKSLVIFLRLEVAGHVVLNMFVQFCTLIYLVQVESHLG